MSTGPLNLYSLAKVLVGRIRKLHIPGVVITVGNAAKFPVLRTPGTATPFWFDRVVCDVPCSGDGTLRKEPEIWRSWHPRNGLELHAVQLKLLVCLNEIS